MNPGTPAKEFLIQHKHSRYLAATSAGQAFIVDQYVRHDDNSDMLYTLTYAEYVAALREIVSIRDKLTKN